MTPSWGSGARGIGSQVSRLSGTERVWICGGGNDTGLELAQADNETDNDKRQRAIIGRRGMGEFPEWFEFALHGGAGFGGAALGDMGLVGEPFIGVEVGLLLPQVLFGEKGFRLCPLGRSLGIKHGVQAIEHRRGDNGGAAHGEHGFPRRRENA